MITYTNIFTDFPDILSVSQMAKMLCIGRNSAYKLLSENKIKSLRIGNVHKIPKINVIEYLNSSIDK